MKERQNMKKLMIAAAAAAMIGGVQATTLVYDFTASVKTTTAKSSKASATCNLGQDGTGTWWYQDGVFTNQSKDKNGNPIANYYDYDSVVFGTSYPKALYVNPNTGVGTLKLSDNQGKMELATEIGGAYNVPEIWKGKPKWCATFKYTVENCCRVAGSRKYSTVYTIKDCCGKKKFECADGAAYDLTTSLLYRFGSIDFAKATKVEFAGWIGDPKFNAATIAQKQSSLSTVVAHLAGQGTWAVLDKTSKTEGVQSISGNVVAVVPNDKCNICCGAKNWDLVFNCDFATSGVFSYDALTIANWEGWETAAFGTFTLKINTKKSTF